MVNNKHPRMYSESQRPIEKVHDDLLALLSVICWNDDGFDGKLSSIRKGETFLISLLRFSFLTTYIFRVCLGMQMCNEEHKFRIEKLMSVLNNFDNLRNYCSNLGSAGMVFYVFDGVFQIKCNQIVLLVYNRGFQITISGSLYVSVLYRWYLLDQRQWFFFSTLMYVNFLECIMIWQHRAIPLLTWLEVGPHFLTDT